MARGRAQRAEFDEARHDFIGSFLSGGSGSERRDGPVWQFAASHFPGRPGNPFFPFTCVHNVFCNLLLTSIVELHPISHFHSEYLLTRLLSHYFPPLCLQTGKPWVWSLYFLTVSPQDGGNSRPGRGGRASGARGRRYGRIKRCSHFPTSRRGTCILILRYSLSLSLSPLQRLQRQPKKSLQSISPTLRSAFRSPIRLSSMRRSATLTLLSRSSKRRE